MTSGFLLLFCIVVSAVVAGAAECENGWVRYSDELCIKVFTSYLSYSQAKGFCSLQGIDEFPASLVMVKSADMQTLLENYTKSISDNIWLGGKYDLETAQYTWEDGSPLAYSNWQEGYPQMVSHPDNCIELSSLNRKGRWVDVTCLRRNLVVCQKTLSLTLKDVFDEIRKLQQQLEQVYRELQATRQDLQETNQNLESVSLKVVPVGSIYIEYHGQPSPRTIWPTYTWEDISSSYAGLFFRVSGGEAASWGSEQDGCAPRITTMQRTYRHTGGVYPYPLDIPANGWSVYGDDGIHYHPTTAEFRFVYDGVRFHTQGCEVRPKNKAIRVWKRTA